MTKEEFDARISHIRKKLQAIARRMLPADEDEDAVQSAILLAWEHLPQLKDENAFDAWITQILVNQCRQQIKRRKLETQALRHLEQAHRETASLNHDCLYDALDAMKPEMRDTLLMHHAHGDSIKDMAQKLHLSESAVKMRLLRARKQLRLLLISLLLLIMLASVAIGTGLLDVNWFLSNRRATQMEEQQIDFETEDELSYSGHLLNAELTDVKWIPDKLLLRLTYDITGTNRQVLTVHAGDIGVDGVHFDHIWTDEGILPIVQWSQNTPVIEYALDGWHMGSLYLLESEDYLADGLGEAFFSTLNLGELDPETYASVLDARGELTLECSVTIREWDSHHILEKGTLALRIAAPEIDEWRRWYEAYYRN